MRFFNILSSNNPCERYGLKQSIPTNKLTEQHSINLSKNLLDIGNRNI